MTPCDTHWPQIMANFPNSQATLPQVGVSLDQWQQTDFDTKLGADQLVWFLLLRSAMNLGPLKLPCPACCLGDYVTQRLSKYLIVLQVEQVQQATPVSVVSA